VGSDGQDDLRQAWERHAREWIAWARRPGHDVFERFHRDQFFDLLPPPGRLTIEVGCGEGRVCRALKQAGHTVVGVDSSPTLVAAALEADPAIPVHRADAAAIPLNDGEADLAVAFMSLQDFDQLDHAVGEIARVLEPDGVLCLAVVHPLNSAGHFQTEEPTSPFIIEEPYLAERRYSDHLERDGLTMTFESWHRPLAQYTASLLDNGFTIEALREPSVPESAVTADRQRRWQRLPLFLHIRARKTGAASR
jgi:SAM-dependent methyltransferase